MIKIKAEISRRSEKNESHPHLLSCLWQKMVFKAGFRGHFGELVSFPGPLPCIHVIKVLFDFLSVKKFFFN